MARGNGLSDAYTATLTRLMAQKGNKPALGLKALMWVSYSERPLQAVELCHALGVEIGSTDLDPENVPAIRTLLSSCLGLLTVEASSSTVRLVHFTLQEHLLSDPTLFNSPHTSIAEVCLTYLNFRSVRDLSPSLGEAPSTMPFLEYASICWGEYTRSGITENVKILALHLLDRFDEHISAELMLLSYERDRFFDPLSGVKWGPLGFTGLHAVVYFGIVEVVAAILQNKDWDVNASDFTGSTALTWAAYRGWAEVVKLLLKRRDINPDLADTQYGRTPLSWAVKGGHEGVAKMLLERVDVNPNQADPEYGRTPLSLAAECGNEGVVKMLLERVDVNPDQADTEYGRTPLSWAAKDGYEGIVKILLKRREVNPNQADTWLGQTPLSLAAEGGHEGVVKALLRRKDINPNQADTMDGRKPQSLAAASGHEVLVKLVSQRKDVNSNQADTWLDQTPLSCAAWMGHEGVVKILMDGRNVGPDQTDTQYDRTLLPLAAAKGAQGVVNVSLERNDVRKPMRDNNKNQAPPPLSPPKAYAGAVDIPLEPGNLNSDEACLDVSTSTSPDDDLPATEPSVLPQAASLQPPKLPCPPHKSDTHPNSIPSTLPIVINRYWVIGPCICLLGFLAYRKYWHN